jgi:putative hemolysin
MFVWDFLIILVLIALNAFFTSVEFASVASRKTRIELITEEGNASAKIVKSWLEDAGKRSRLIAACQLGITLVSLALGAVGENTFQALLEPRFSQIALGPNLQELEPVLAALPLIISLIIISSIHVVLGEQVPKVATLQHPERVALLGAQPIRIFSIIFKWLIDVLDWATQLILRLFGLKVVGEHTLIYSVDELKQMINESEESGVIESPEADMLESVFDFELIIGILHVKDVLHVMNQPDSQDTTARALARETLYFPESLPVNQLLYQFRHNRQHIAIVLDEYGGTAGLVTLEDLLEEIVGEVSDQFDETVPEIQNQPDGSVLIDGLTLIDAVNQQLSLTLSDPHYDTIAGYFLGKLGHIPKIGDSVEAAGVRLQVKSMDGLRISQLKLMRTNTTPPD